VEPSPIRSTTTEPLEKSAACAGAAGATTVAIDASAAKPAVNLGSSAESVGTNGL